MGGDKQKPSYGNCATAMGSLTHPHPDLTGQKVTHLETEIISAAFSWEGEWVETLLLCQQGKPKGQTTEQYNTEVYIVRQTCGTIILIGGVGYRHVPGNTRLLG